MSFGNRTTDVIELLKQFVESYVLNQVRYELPKYFVIMPKFDCQVRSYLHLIKIGRQRVSYVVCKLLRF